jgi:hypothetical protein
MTKKQRNAIATRWKYNDQGMTLKEFIASAQTTVGMDDAIAIKWCNMWLVIETDGYTHS